jgi:hypothetical protein
VTRLTLEEDPILHGVSGGFSGGPVAISGGFVEENP